MKIVLLYNPTSGHGRAQAAVDHLLPHLRDRGHEVVALTIAQSDRLDDDAANAAALILVGGDGTVARSLAAVERLALPIYHVPTGNENLFAAAFAHTADPATVATTLERGTTRAIDLGIAAHTSNLAAPTRFAIMLSFGPDASVIHRLGAVRSRSRGHLAYTRPLLDELAAVVRGQRLPALRVWVDGKKVADDAGWLVVANMPQYALGVNPAGPDVDPCDGQLNVAFFPMRTALGLLPWAARCRLGLAASHPAFVSAFGREIVVEGDGPWQFDGEPGRVLTSPDRLRIESRPAAARVFV
ncbi:MAG TPA: diacylglycerol kinase family protein [Phycisphaerales bacterium]